MAPPQKLEGTSSSSFSEAVQDATREVDGLSPDEEVTYELSRSYVRVGGNKGGTTYHVEFQSS